jgi:hypothetical protein
MGNYQIVYNSIMLAMDKREVEDAFARLFKLSPEKAAAILAKPQTVLRRDLDGETAEVYREKLMAIGLDVDVRDMSMKSSGCNNRYAFTCLWYGYAEACAGARSVIRRR